ncbi:hypothetical protein J5N97_017795 [Dioscorea zingiberensis]|uniref:DUF1068 domain-containing protein n=1 Tax=Dioscorea zingiberensis TaxID=325984 RepID=A0A9D5CM97_9LILI|nr:hypothetical protein J5N97_017795 [Dioscorea zingiberensis]
MAGAPGGLNPRLVKALLVAMALGLAAYLCGPPLYWHLAEALGRASSSSCPACSCDCASQPLLSLPKELGNVSFTDCAKRDPEVSEEMEKSVTELLTEELKLRESDAIDGRRHAEMMLLEAKKMSSQYQKEADKCSSGMDTCEEARERAEAIFLEQKKLTALWQMRARQRGWKQS